MAAIGFIMMMGAFSEEIPEWLSPIIFFIGLILFFAGMPPV